MFSTAQGSGDLNTHGNLHKLTEVDVCSPASAPPPPPPPERRKTSFATLKPLGNANLPHWGPPVCIFQHLGTIPDAAELLDYPQWRHWRAFGTTGLDVLLTALRHDERGLEQFEAVCGIKSIRQLLQPHRTLRCASAPPRICLQAVLVVSVLVRSQVSVMLYYVGGSRPKLRHVTGACRPAALVHVEYCTEPRTRS